MIVVVWDVQNQRQLLVGKKNISPSERYRKPKVQCREYNTIANLSRYRLQVEAKLRDRMLYMYRLPLARFEALGDMYAEDYLVDQRVQNKPKELDPLDPLDPLDFCRKSDCKEMDWILGSVSYGTCVLDPRFFQSHQMCHTIGQGHGSFDPKRLSRCEVCVGRGGER